MKPEKKKSSSLGTINRSSNGTFIDAEMLKAASFPGVGQYKAHRQTYDKKLGKLNKSISEDKIEISPGATDYSPTPIDQKLFSFIQKVSKPKPSFSK